MEKTCRATETPAEPSRTENRDVNAVRYAHGQNTTQSHTVGWPHVSAMNISELSVMTLNIGTRIAFQAVCSSTLRHLIFRTK